MIQRLWVQTPLGTIFDNIYFELKYNVNTSIIATGTSSSFGWYLEKNERGKKTFKVEMTTRLSLADPGFGQGGAQIFFQRFC